MALLDQLSAPRRICVHPADLVNFSLGLCRLFLQPSGYGCFWVLQVCSSLAFD